MTQKPKKKKLASDSLNWRNKEVPLQEMMRIKEEPQEEEPPKTTDTDKIKEHQGTLTIAMDEGTMETLDEGTMETLEAEPTTDILKGESAEFIQASINVLAQLEMDNSPLEEL